MSSRTPYYEARQRLSSGRKQAAGKISSREDHGSISSLFTGVRWSAAYVGFLLYVFVVVSYRFGIADIAIGLAGAAILLRGRSLKFPPLLGWFAAFLVWSAFGLGLTSYPAVVQEHLILYGKLWIITFVAVNVLDTPARTRFFLVFFLACFATHPARGALFNTFVYTYTLFGRATWRGIFENPNDLAALTFLPLGVAAGLLVTERDKWIRYGSLASVFILSLIILLTQSRGGFFAFAVVGGFVVLRRRFDLRRIAMFALLGGTLLVLAPSGLWDRVGNFADAVEAGSLQQAEDMNSAYQRYTIWKVAGEVVGRRPVLGVGLGAYRYAHEKVAAKDPEYAVAQGQRDVHNTFLDVLAETGIVGLLLFLGMIATVVLDAHRVQRRARDVSPSRAQQLDFLELALFAYLLAGVFGTYGHLSFLYLHLAILFVLTQIVRQEIRGIRGRPLDSAAAVVGRGRGGGTTADSRRLNRSVAKRSSVPFGS